MIPVYVAADASGKAVTGADGNPIVVPTDKDGKLPAALPTGVVKTPSKWSPSVIWAVSQKSHNWY